MLKLGIFQTLNPEIPPSGISPENLPMISPDNSRRFLQELCQGIIQEIIQRLTQKFFKEFPQKLLQDISLKIIFRSLIMGIHPKHITKISSNIFPRYYPKTLSISFPGNPSRI